MSLTYSLHQPRHTWSRTTAIALIVLLHAAAFIAFNNGIGTFFKTTPPPPLTVVDVQPDPPAQVPLPVPDIPKAAPDKTIDAPILDPTDLKIDVAPDISDSPPVDSNPSDSAIPTVSKLSVTSRIDPVYPASAQAAGQQGVVLLDVQVDPYGNVMNVSILQSSGFSELDAAAVQAVKRWHFAPISTGAHVRVPIRFQLNSQKH